ncbi:hypothetical protein pipiens_013278, partial [Culex pipiens pipiens]
GNHRFQQIPPIDELLWYGNADTCSQQPIPSFLTGVQFASIRFRPTTDSSTAGEIRSGEQQF